MESQSQGNVCLLLWLRGPMHPCRTNPSLLSAREFLLLKQQDWLFSSTLDVAVILV